jgi:hypothetical protein
MLNFSDSRNFTRTLAALSLLVTPVLLLLAVLIGPDLGDDPAEELAAIADNEAGFVISGLLFLIAPLVLLPGMMGTIRLMRRRGVTLGQIGAGLILFGALLTMAFYGFGVVQYVAATDDGVSRPEMVKLFDAAEDSGLAFPIFVGFVLGLILGSILLAISLWRNRVVPVWGPIALVLSSVLGFVGESTVVGAISFVLLFVGLFPIAQKILSISDDEWEGWQLPERAAASPPPPAPAEGTPPG